MAFSVSAMFLEALEKPNGPPSPWTRGWRHSKAETAKSAFLKCHEKEGLTDMGSSFLTPVTGPLVSGSWVCPRAGVLYFCSRNAGGVHCLAIILWVLFKGVWRVTSEEWQQELIHSSFSLLAKPPGTAFSFRGQDKGNWICLWDHRSLF